MARKWLSNTDPAFERCFQPVALRDELDAVGGLLGVQLGGRRYVVASLGGSLAAFADRCPHRAAPLSAGRIVDDTVECPYHGYRFAASGRCVEIPAQSHDIPIVAKADIAPLNVTERYGLIWLCRGEPLVGIPDIPEVDDPEFTLTPLPRQVWRTSAAQMADNFLDVAHFPFTHRYSIGDPDDRQVAAHPVVREGWRFNAEHRHTAKVLADATQGLSAYQLTERVMRFECVAPHHTVLRIEYLDSGSKLVLGFFCQPIDESTTWLYVLQLRNDISPDDASFQEATDFQIKVTTEDRLLLEQIPEKGMDLDPTADVHTRADRLTVELRRMLADLVTLPIVE